MQYQNVQSEGYLYPYYYNNFNQNTLIQEINYYKGMINGFIKEKEEYIKKEESYKDKIKDLEKIIENKISNSKSDSKKLSENNDIFKTIDLDKDKNKTKRKNNNKILSNQSNIFNHRLLNFNYNSESNKNVEGNGIWGNTELSSNDSNSKLNSSFNLQESTILSPQLKVKSVDRSNRIKSTPYNKFNTFICPYCPDKKEFTSKIIYKNHINIHNNNEFFKKISPTLKCDECLLTFSTSRAKSIHNTKYH